MTGHPEVVVRAKSKRELIYTLARPHMLRSAERWLAASKKGRPGWLAVGNPRPGPPLQNRIAGSAAGLYTTCFATLHTEHRLGLRLPTWEVGLLP